MTTARVGSGQLPDTREGFGALCKEGFGAWRFTADCAKSFGPREEKRDAARQLFPETENVRRLTDYIAAIVIRWAIKRTPNAMKLDRRSIYTKIRPHANFQLIRRTFSGHL